MEISFKAGENCNLLKIFSKQFTFFQKLFSKNYKKIPLRENIWIQMMSNQILQANT
jgi:hypothetical protein